MTSKVTVTPYMRDLFSKYYAKPNTVDDSEFCKENRIRQKYLKNLIQLAGQQYRQSMEQGRFSVPVAACPTSVPSPLPAGSPACVNSGRDVEKLVEESKGFVYAGTIDGQEAPCMELWRRRFEQQACEVATILSVLDPGREVVRLLDDMIGRLTDAARKDI